MIKLILTGLALVGMCAGQAAFTASKTTVLSSSAEVITVQQPAAGGKVVRFVGAYLDSTVSCGFTIERNGTAATATTLAPVALNPTIAPAATATAWSASNVGTGSVITRGTVSAGGWFYVDLSRVYMNAGAGIGVNLTLRTASCTGTVDIVITYTENPT